MYSRLRPIIAIGWPLKNTRCPNFLAMPSYNHEVVPKLPIK